MQPSPNPIYCLPLGLISIYQHRLLNFIALPWYHGTFTIRSIIELSKWQLSGPIRVLSRFNTLNMPRLLSLRQPALCVVVIVSMPNSFTTVVQIASLVYHFLVNHLASQLVVCSIHIQLDGLTEYLKFSIFGGKFQSSPVLSLI